MNCKACNIAAPQYELFDGLCGKCLMAQAAAMREALMGYASCSDGCTCGDGWSHSAAEEALRVEAGREYVKKLAAMTSCLEHIKTLALECREDPKIVLSAVGLSAIGALNLDK